MSKKRMLKSNKEALRWCANRRAVIYFTDWIEIETERKIVQCEIYLGKRKRVNSTFLKTVNTWIQAFRGDLS